MKSKKRRKLKKGFKRFLFIFFLVVIVLTLYILNKEKVISLNNFWQNTKSIFVKDNNSENPLDENIDTNDFVAIFKARLPSKGLEFYSSGEILQNGDMKIFLNNTKDNSGYIYVNTNDKAEYVWITFVSAIDAEPLKTKLKDNLEDLDYIDLRFSNKVFYKFKDTNVDILAPQNETNIQPENLEEDTSNADVGDSNALANEENSSTTVMFSLPANSSSTDSQ